MDDGRGNHLTEQKVTCPHCWHGFYSDQAVYISRHPGLFGDPVLGSNAHTRFSPQEARIDREQKALDPKGWPMVERACPTCHLQIPLDLLIRRPLFVSVVGAPRSGKTYFLTAMIQYLRRELAQSFGYALHDCDSHEIRAFLDYEQALFFPADPSALTVLQKTQEFGSLYNTIELGGAQVQLPKPFIFSLQPTESNIDVHRHGALLRQSIVLYDNAGESFDVMRERESAYSRVTEHVACSDAILFAFDPLQEPQLRQRLVAVSDDPQLGQFAATFRQETILTEVVNRIRRQGSVSADKRINTPLLVAVQKYDVWRSLLAHGTQPRPDGGTVIDDTSVEFVPEKGIAGLDVEEINAISLLVRRFLQDLCPQFVASAEANFRIIRYFPVSALGTSPEYDPNSSGNAPAEMLKVRPRDLQPFRVTSPMQWLLHRWQLIRQYRHAPAQGVPVAKVESYSDERIRVVMPGGTALLMLDREYAGSVIVDPATGSRVRVPSLSELEKTLAVGSQTNESPGGGTAPTVARNRSEPHPAAGFALRLPDPPPVAKRGWFRKG